MIQDYNVYFPDPWTHHLLADATGNSAIVEYIDGEIVVTRNKEPWQVSTNFLIAGEEPGGSDEAAQRYDIAYGILSPANGAISEEDAMDIARRTSQGSTVWSIVYNLTTGNIQLAMGREYDQVYAFKLELTR